MGVTVSVSHPAFPEGTLFGINYLGAVPNGGSLEVPEENEQEFVNATGKSVADSFPEGGVVTVSGTSDVQVPEAPTEAPQEAPPSDATEGSVS